MLPRRFLLLADNPLTLAQLRAEIEDLGEETRCQTALTAEEALFRLSQESVDAVLLLPALAAAHLPECTELARQLLTALGMPRTLRAWAFLPEMAALTVVHPPLLTDVTHGLYPLMARRAQLTPCAVERRLRLAIESTWNRGDYDAIARFFGQSVDPERGKPTNREFLCQLQERLTLSARRMERRVG